MMPHSGFVDLQVNGFCGADFTDPSTRVDDILAASRKLMEQGTVGFLATVISAPRQVMEACVRNVAEVIRRQPGGGGVLGIHLEGPFISPEYGYRGMHEAAVVSTPDLLWFERLQELADGNIRMITLAPEVDGAAEFIAAVAPSVVVSAGHTNCSFAQLRRTVASGLSLVTHIGNACRQTIDRHNNPIVNQLAIGELDLSFIPDGFHLPEAFCRMLFNARPVDKLIVVSDVTKYAGLPPGRYTMSSGTDVELHTDGKLSLASDPDLMAGSGSTMLQCMNHLASLEFLSEEELWKVGFDNPVRVLGLRREALNVTDTGVWYDAETHRFEMNHASAV